METYIKGVIVMGSVCSVILSVLHGDSVKKYVRYISQLALLLVLLIPLSGALDFVGALRTDIVTPSVGESGAEVSVISKSAENISKYIAETCGEKFALDPNNIRVRLIIDESDPENVLITEIQLFTDVTGSEEKNRIKRYFEELLQTEVYVFGP
ncbi:MAG: hypothetical protein IJ457_03675 [Clostridia bacterium]|nr:hypothetical protein [Clostridia bacterium]